MNPRPMTISANYLAMVRGLRELHRLTVAGRQDSPEADAVRDATDGPMAGAHRGGEEEAQRALRGPLFDHRSTAGRPVRDESPGPISARRRGSGPPTRRVGQGLRAAQALGGVTSSRQSSATCAVPRGLEPETPRRRRSSSNMPRSCSRRMATISGYAPRYAESIRSARGATACRGDPRDPRPIRAGRRSPTQRMIILDSARVFRRRRRLDSSSGSFPSSNRPWKSSRGATRAASIARRSRWPAHCWDSAMSLRERAKRP